MFVINEIILGALKLTNDIQYRVFVRLQNSGKNALAEELLVSTSGIKRTGLPLLDAGKTCSDIFSFLIELS